MATLISQHNSDGCVGRCDAKCYNAKGRECDCICGGKNHGVGLKQAVENTVNLAETLVESATHKQLRFPPIQLPLELE